MSSTGMSHNSCDVDFKPPNGLPAGLEGALVAVKANNHYPLPPPEANHYGTLTRVHFKNVPQTGDLTYAELSHIGPHGHIIHHAGHSGYDTMDYRIGRVTIPSQTVTYSPLGGGTLNMPTNHYTQNSSLSPNSAQRQLTEYAQIDFKRSNSVYSNMTGIPRGAGSMSPSCVDCGKYSDPSSTGGSNALIPVGHYSPARSDASGSQTSRNTSHGLLMLANECIPLDLPDMIRHSDAHKAQNNSMATTSLIMNGGKESSYEQERTPLMQYSSPPNSSINNQNNYKSHSDTSQAHHNTASLVNGSHNQQHANNFLGAEHVTIIK